MTMPNINALLLAGGLGTRLRPLTNTIPKCLVPIGGKPLLERWLDTLSQINCTRVLINKHYLAEQVDALLESVDYSEMNVQTIFEEQLLGTAGTLLKNKDFFDKSGVNLMIHADNATDISLDELITAHLNRAPGCILTMLTFNTDSPETCGIVKTDRQGIVVEFHEKKASPPGNCANGAIYAFDQDLLDVLSNLEDKPSDFSTQILPMLVGRIQTCHTNSAFLDVGTIENLNRAQSLWADQSV